MADQDIINMQTELLKDSLFEIEKLREINIYQAARLKMFDDVMLLLKSNPSREGAINGGEDITWRLKSFIRNIESGTTSNKQ